MPDSGVEAATPRFGVVRSLAYSTALIALFFLLCEGGVRVYAWWLRQEAERFDPSTGTFLLVPGKHRTRYTMIEVNSQGFVGEELGPLGPDLWRIVTIGDSCTFGEGNSKYTYPAMLDVRLRARERRGLRYDVVNAGISGLNSELALRRLRTVVPPLAPDVITIYIGWNDLMKADPHAQSEVSRWSPVARSLNQLYLVKAWRKLIFYWIRPAVLTASVGPASRTGRFSSFRPSIYEGNLREMVKSVREIGARPLLTTLPSVVRSWMSGEDLRGANVFFPYFSGANSVGDFLDLIAAYNAVIRDVSASEGVPLADLDKDFDALADPRSFFLDTLHTNREGMTRIAAVLERRLAEEGLLGTQGVGDMPRDAQD